MIATDLVELAYTGAFLWFLWAAWVLWVRPLWVERRQPVRKDAPTGDKPWVKPYSRK